MDNLGRLFGDDCDDGNDEKCWWATATSTDALLSAADPSIPSREEWKQIADGSNGGIIEDLLDVVEGMQEVDLDQEEESETSEKVHHDEEGSSSMFLSSLVSSLIPTCRTAATQDRTSTIQSQEVNACQDPGRTTSSTSSSSCWRLSLLSSSSPPAPPPLAFQIASIPVERYDDEGLAAEEEDNVEYSMDNNSEGDEATHSSEEELVTSMKKLERILLLLPPPTQRGVVGRHEENSMIPSVCQITIDTTTITRDEKEASNTTVDKVVSSSPNNVVVVVVDVTREEWKTFGEERGILRDLILLLSF